MTSEITDPPIRTPLPDASVPGDPNSRNPPPPAIEAVDTPVIPPYSSTSGDELNVLLSESLAKPDPLLGEFAEDQAGEARPEPPPAAVVEPGLESSGESYDANAILSALADPTPVEPIVGAADVSHSEGAHSAPPSALEAGPDAPSARESSPRAEGLGHDEGSGEALFRSSSFDLVPAADSGEDVPRPASFDAFPAVDLGAPPAATMTPESVEDEEEEEVDEEPRSRGSSVLMFLLFSYASAVTLGLVWVLLSGRRLRESDEGDINPPADTRPDPGRRADQSRKVPPAPPIAADHLVTLGKAIRMGDLQVTPLAITSGPVTLKREITSNESRKGGSDALKLKLRLKNLSKDTILAPLDEAFLRERDRDILDSLIETADGGEIAMYPLAVTSEWSIAGQEFREIRPGESYDTLVVSSVDTSSRRSPEMTWHVRLRTGIDRTDTLGVRFGEKEIVPGS